MKYRKRPIVIEAVQWTGMNPYEIEKFCGKYAKVSINDAAWEVGVAPPVVYVTIKTLEGDMSASVGDFIIKGINGEFYPCKPDIFAKTYEEVKE